MPTHPEASFDPQQRIAAIERALLASEARLRTLVNSAQDAIVVMDSAGLVVEWNPRAEWMFGYRAGEAIGQRLSKLIIPPELRQAHETGLRKFLETRRVKQIGRVVEQTAIHRDGRSIPIELAIWPLDAGDEMMFGAFIRDITARQAAERALRTEQQKYRSVVDNVSEGILVVRDGRMVFANPSTERLIGRPIDSLMNVPFTEFIHPDDQPLVRERHLRRLRGEEVEQHYPLRILRADGSVIWLELAAVLIEWEGAPATLSFITDITERRRLEDELKLSLIERETILENSIVGIAFVDPDRRIRWANGALAAILGIEPGKVGEMRGQTPERFYPSREAYLQTGEKIAAAVAAGQGFEIEMPLRKVDGSEFWAYVSGRAVDRSNLLQGTVWAFIDITQRRHLEAALRRKTDEQEAILQSALIGICLISQQRFQWINATLAEMFGYPIEQLMGAPVAQIFVDQGEFHRFADEVRTLLDHHGTYQGTHRFRRADQEEIWVRVHGTRLNPRDGGRGGLWTFVDVTEQHRAEEEVLRSLEKEKELSALKSRFVSMTSHEFRTPLAGILSSTELLRHYGDRLPAEEKIELFEQIEDSVERMTRMLDNILLIGRAESRGLQFRPIHGDLLDFIEQVLTEAKAARHSGQQAPSLCKQIRGVTAGEYLFDPILLRHVLSNLLSNAIKYSPQGGEVSLSVDWSDGRAEIAVSDQGIGIPEDDQKRLFETFHRASNVGNIAGTGLGLAIVKQAIELQGGRIELFSRPGAGSRFTIHLPIERAGAS